MPPKKPVVILKGGRTPAGTRAVISHTSSLAGDTQVWDAVCCQPGAVRAASLPEIVDLLLAFSYLKSQDAKRGRGWASSTLFDPIDTSSDAYWSRPLSPKPPGS